MSHTTKRVLRSLLSLIIVAGVAVALWPVGQSAYARWNQNSLRAQWSNQASKTAPSTTRKAADKTSQTVRSASTSARALVADWPGTRIIIPDIELDAVVVQGMDEDALRRGPGHAPSSALPGQTGNCVIAAHRNVYGSWFYKVDQLWPGSRITLRTPQQDFHYQIISVFTTADTNLSVLKPPAEKDAPPRLTLLTCTVPRSTSRVVVVAQLLPPETVGFG